MCMLFTILVYLYFSGIFLKSSDSRPICISIIICIVIIDYISRLKIKNLIVFFIIHFGLIAISVIIPAAVMDKVILGFISAAFLLMAFNFWKTDANERSHIAIDIPFGGIVAFIIVYFHSTFFSSDIAAYSYAGGIAFFLLYFIREYLEKFISYSMSSENFSKELKHTFNTNFSLIALFNVAIVLIIMTANMFFSNSSFNVVGKFFKWIASKFFSCFEHFHADGGASEQVTTEIPLQNNSAGETLVAHSSSNDSGIGTLIFNVFQIVLFIALIAGILFIIYSFIKQYMHRNNKTDDEVKNTEEDVINKVKITKETNADSHKSFFASNKDKIRKIFANKVNASTKKNNRIIIRKSYTPDQINNTLTKENAISKEDMDMLTKIYEKARYSDKEITKEDVEKAKHITSAKL